MYPLSVLGMLGECAGVCVRCVLGMSAGVIVLYRCECVN